MTELKKIAQNQRLWLSGIFLVAIIVRLIYLIDALDCPLLFYPGLDPEAYDLWAQRIAQGDWLGKQVFYQSPLYPYLLGIFYSLFGRHLFWVYILQILVGGIDCLLIYGIGKLAFGRKAGLVAGIFSALYKPFIFYQALLLKTFLEVFLIDLTIFLLLWVANRPKKSIIFLSGLALGLGALARDNFIILVFWFFPWLIFRLKKSEKTMSAIYFLLGFVLIITISGIRNWVVGKNFVLTTSQAGQNFYIGNHLKNLTGTYIPPDFVIAHPFYEEKNFREEAIKRTGKEDLKPSEISNFWFKETIKEINSDWGLFFQRLILKLALFWNQKEIADNENIYLMKKEFSFLLRLPLLDFGIIGALGLLGLVLALRTRRGVLLSGYVVIYWLSVSLFFIFSRYRLAVVGVVLAFAGFALEQIYLWVKEKQWKSLAGNMVLLGGFFALVWAPLIRETSDYAYFNLGNSYVRAGKFRQAISAYQKAIELNPHQADFWINLGKAGEKVGDNELSLRAFSNAILLAPEKANAHFGLGIALFKIGEYNASELELKRALELEPNLQEAKIYLEMAQSKISPETKRR